VLPNLVKEGSQKLIQHNAVVTAAPNVNEQIQKSISIKSVNYTELIPIVIKAMQEQQEIIEQQNAKIDALTQLVNRLEISSAKIRTEGASLDQNRPNPPLANSTIINYHLPSGTASAQLIFTNVAGQKVKQMQLDNSGRITINTSSFSAGTYFYTLSVNGKFLQTKKMVISR